MKSQGDHHLSHEKGKTEGPMRQHVRLAEGAKVDGEHDPYGGDVDRTKKVGNAKKTW